MGKITINYDLYEQILNAREKFNGFKYIRANRKIVLFDICFFLTTDFAIRNFVSDFDVPRMFIEQLLICGSTRYLPEKICDKLFDIDRYEIKVREKLLEVIPMLNNINVSTNYELLLGARLDSKNYEIQKDNTDKKVLVRNKYIMVPTHNPMFNNDGETQMTSLHQEHIVGTNEYSLSVGLNQKNKQKVLSPLLNQAKR